MRLKWRRGHRGALQLLLKAAFNASMCVPGPVRGNNTLATKVSALESGLFPSPVAKREWRPTLVQEAKGPPAGEKQTRSQLRLWRRREDLLPRHRDALQLLLDFLDVDHWGVSRGLVERVEHQVVSEHDYRHQHLQRFRGGLVFKAHRRCVSLNSRLESNTEEETPASITRERSLSKEKRLNPERTFFVHRLSSYTSILGDI